MARLWRKTSKWLRTLALKFLRIEKCARDLATVKKQTVFCGILIVRLRQRPVVADASESSAGTGFHSAAVRQIPVAAESH